MTRSTFWTLSTLAAGLLTTACGDDGGPGADAGPTGPAETVEEVLARLNVDTTETPREDPSGEPLPEDHAPLGGRRDLQRFAEIAVLGVQAPGLAGTDPFYVLKEVADANNDYAATLLHQATAADLPWASISGDRPTSQRDATRGDVDGDGFEELILLYKVPTETYVELVIVDDEAGGFSRSEPVVVGEADVVDLAVVAADFDGDGRDDVAAGLVEAASAQIVMLTSDGTGVSVTGDAVALTPMLDDVTLDLRLAAANLDYDNGAELGLVLNEISSNGATATYKLFDDLDRDLAELASGFVRAEVGVDTHTAKAADIAFGDIDGDQLPEVVFGGLTETSTSDGFRDQWGYLVYALEDLPAGLTPLSGTHFVQTFDQLSESGQSLTMDAFFVSTLDVDGDGVDEIQANQYVYDDLLNAAPWTELHQIPEGDLIYESGDGSVWFQHHNVAMEVSDVTSDGREDLIFYSQNQDDIRVWGIDQIDGWSQMAMVDTQSTNGQTPIWPVIVPTNVDDDSIALVYSEGTHQLVFTEPVIIAALAAAPCNPDWGQDTSACTTAFGFAESSSVSLEDSYTITAGATVGFSQEFSVLGVQVGGVELLANVNTAATKTQGSAYSLTKRVVHTTGPIEDSVLFTTIPMDQYTYTIASHPNPELIGGELVLSMPREPIQALVTRELYNASVLEESLKIGDDVFGHVPGDPTSYPSRGDKDAILAASEGLESPEVDVGEGGGNTGVELSVYEEVSQGSSYSIDFSLDFKATAGSVVVGASVGYGQGHTINYASGQEASYAGNVANLDAEHFASDQYKFGLFTYIHEEAGRQYEVLNYWVHAQAQ